VRFQGIPTSADSRELSFDRALGWQGPSSELNLNVGTEEKRRQAAALPKCRHRAAAGSADCAENLRTGICDSGNKKGGRDAAERTHTLTYKLGYQMRYKESRSFWVAGRFPLSAFAKSYDHLGTQSVVSMSNSVVNGREPSWRGNSSFHSFSRQSRW